MQFDRTAFEQTLSRVTQTLLAWRRPEGHWEGELSMPASVARLVGQSLLDVTGNLGSVEIQME